MLINFSEAGYSVCESGGPIQVCSTITSGQSAAPIPISLSTITGSATSMLILFFIIELKYLLTIPVLVCIYEMYVIFI